MSLGTLGQWDWSHLEWDAREMSGMSHDSGDSGTVGLEPSRVGCSGHVWDVPQLWGLWDSGIRVGCSGHIWDVLGFPWTLGWDGELGLEPSRVEHLGHVRDVPGLPGTLRWDGQ